MTRSRRALALFALASALAAAPVAAAVAARAAPAHSSVGTQREATRGAVYVLSNQPGGNAVVRYERHRDGSLVPAGTFPTGGTGTGGGLGSQGALTLDGSGRYLYAVNPGSSTLTSFRVRRDGLQLIDVVPSGGSMPTSVTVHDGLVYVLNAAGDGNVSGFRVHAGDLEPLAGSIRPLSAAGTQPAQVSFSPAGDRLIVTERATQRFDVYTLGRSGRPIGVETMPSSGVTPFGFAFDRRHHLVVSEAWGGAADASAVSSYDVRRRRFDAVSSSVPTTETAACWIAITPNGRFAYAGNATSMSITGYAIGRHGELDILTADGKTASAPGSVADLAISSDGRHLYARLGNGTVGGWAIRRDGTLGALGTFPGLPAGAAGIAAG